MKIQMKVLREIKLSRGKITVEELVYGTELSKRQVYDALTDLKRRKLIIKKREDEYKQINNPSKKKIYVELNMNVKNRIEDVLTKEKEEKEEKKSKEKNDK